MTRGTAFHLLDEGEVSVLRCFMTLILLPTHTAAMMDNAGFTFSAALDRVLRLPTFRKACASLTPPQDLWVGMNSTPFLVLLIGHSVPSWLDKLIRDRPVGLLSPNSHTVDSLRERPNLHVGLLRGMEDLGESYRVYRDLFSSVEASRSADPDIRAACRTLIQKDLLTNRPRVPFIPPLPLPAPWDGRAATYLINRFSNNVDKPSLLATSIPKGAPTFSYILDRSLQAAAVLALLETKTALPKHIPINRADLERFYSDLTSDRLGRADQFKTMMELGDRIVAGKAVDRSLLVLPVPRLDLIQGKGPKSITIDEGYKRRSRGGLQAVNDLVRGRETTEFKSEQHKRDYQSARETLMVEQRLIACQAAYLASRNGSTPIQLGLRPGELFNVLADLNRALEANSRKIPQLFRRAELLLAEALPEGIIQSLDSGEAPVVLFSDVPFEWTLIDEWPLCLTRPVSRIPLGRSHWDALAAVLERPIEIHVATPERVLILDLIDSSDSLRQISDSFAFVSDRIGQRYTYASPSTADAFKDVLTQVSPDIVVLDAHGHYDRTNDSLELNLRGNWVALDELLPSRMVPPVWILSACHTSVTGAIRGCLVRELLARGAVAIMATLNRVDAHTASLFVGRLLTEIYRSDNPNRFNTLSDVFFVTQLTTALLYDPLLPLLRRAEGDSGLRKSLSEVFGKFFLWSNRTPLEPRKYRYAVAMELGRIMAEHELSGMYSQMIEAGLVRPETLLFTIFGAPDHIRLARW